MLGPWRGLARFLDDPRRSGQQRHRAGATRHGDRPQESLRLTVYSLIESAKLCGVEPKAYLFHATRAALKNPGTVTLPHALPTT
jgi:hypothetical protein